MTTTTVISVGSMLDEFAKWKHPENVQDRQILIYNCAAVTANAAVAAAVASIALACFSSLAVLGLVLATAFSAVYLAAAEKVDAMDRTIGDRTFQPAAFSIPLLGEDIAIELFRCYTPPEKSEKISEERSASEMLPSSSENENKHLTDLD